MPISVAARPKAWVYGRLLAGIVGSNPAAGMDGCLCCVLSGRGLCDGLITRPEKSYRLWHVVVCDLQTSRMRRPWPALGRSATRGRKNPSHKVTKMGKPKAEFLLTTVSCSFCTFLLHQISKKFHSNLTARMLTEYAVPVEEIHRASAPKCLTLCKYSPGCIFSKLQFNISTRNNRWAGIAQSV